MRSFKRKLPYFVLTILSAGRRVKNIYVKNKPATNDTDRSPVIIAANHTNSHDMPILLKAYGDNVVFLLGKQRLGFLDWLFFWLNGAVFTDRLDRKDTGVTKTYMELCGGIPAYTMGIRKKVYF